VEETQRVRRRRPVGAAERVDSADAGDSIEQPSSSPEPRAEAVASRTSELVHDAAKGDERAWTELVKRFGPMVERIARRTGLNIVDAADVQQATWIQLMRRINQLRDPDRIGAWLATTARRESQRVAVARNRAVLSSDPLTDASVVPDDSTVEKAVLGSHYEPRLESALARLPTSQRQIILSLTSGEGLSYEEVADFLGLAVGSIGPMRFRGLQALRRDPDLASGRSCLRANTATSNDAPPSRGTPCHRPQSTPPDSLPRGLQVSTAI